MKSLWLVLVALLAVTMFHTAHAQESAPKEPPFVDENEFDAPAADPLKAETDDALSIEDEILQSGGQPVPPPAPATTTPAAPAATGQSNTVDLNENVPEAGSSEDLLLEDEEPVIAAPSNEIPEGEILLEEPTTPVKAAAPVYAEEVVSKSRSGGIEYIRHPQSAVGLIRIEKDGTYVYKTSEKKGYSTTGAFRFGMMDAPKIESADGITNFDTMYAGPQVPLLMFEYEWQPFKMSRNFKIQGGLGLLMANGQGRFTETATSGNPTAGQEALEEYTFVAIPLNLGLTYRFQYMDRQILAPFISGGGSYIPVAEFRDDGNDTNFVGTPAAYGAGGILLNIGAMSKDTAYTLRTEYGIANLWATLEYRYLYSFSEDVDFTSNIISAGVTLDY
ncbi:hypothetical protein [Bdellovibrio sp. HCB274]|uniref:hypothetical protein n=1 Tax=Bdellovibrio sp. HCB274 TaxID=3394361 RepID=UPI0039B5D5FF